MKLLAIWLTTAMVAGAPLAAQQDSSLIGIVQLATQGQGDSARVAIGTIRNETAETDSLYPEILYTAGLVASNPDSAISYFTIVGIEYSRSLWADRALLRLAQLAFAAGDPRVANRRANRILRDYPFSEVRGEAGYWAARSQMALGNLSQACSIFGQARIDSDEDIELSNRIGFYMQRCLTMSSSDGADSTANDSTATQLERFSVQVAALRSAATIDQVMRSLRDAGFEARVVSRGTDGLLRIKVGDFANRNEAQQVAADIKRRIGGDPFVVTDP
jgi:hypothetical protein